MTRAEELAEKEWVGELNKALNAKVAELVAVAEALAEAVKAELERIEKPDCKDGSYEELAYAEALRWVLARISTPTPQTFTGVEVPHHPDWRFGADL